MVALRLLPAGEGTGMCFGFLCSVRVVGNFKSAFPCLSRVGTAHEVLCGIPVDVVGLIVLVGGAHPTGTCRRSQVAR
ncbi:MAG: hypothetical protein ACI9Y1_002160 [Lentisphaeria bacterium]|jgi:hypothetical protein